MILIAASAAAACLCVLVLGRGPHEGVRRLLDERVPSLFERYRVATVSAVGASPVLLGTPVALGHAVLPLGHALAVSVAAATLVIVRRGALAERRRRAGRQLLSEGCQVLAAELRAGTGPGPALHQASAVYPGLQPAGRAAGQGHDPGRALAVLLETEPMAGRLMLAWSVSSRTGASLARSVERVADDLSAESALDRLVAGEVAPARATAAVLALLPLAVLLASSSLGFPVAEAMQTVAGQVSVLVGVGLASVGVAWIDRLASNARSAPHVTGSRP